MKKLTIIIPVFNEGKTVGKLLKNVLSTKLPVNKIEYIIVDDGSTDNSIKEIKSLKSKKVILILHKKNRGKGAAIQTGLKKATGDYIIIQDADLEYNPKDIAKLIKAVTNKYLVVYG